MQVNEFDQPIGEPVPGWSPRPLPRRVDLRGRQVRLADLTPEHDQQLFDVLCAPGDEPLWTYLFEGPFRTVREFAGFTAGLRSQPQTRVPLVILDAADERVLGTASYFTINRPHGTIEVGAVLFSPALQRTRAATEAMYLMAKHAFDDLGYRRYEWKCDSLNEPSRAAALRLGFTFEGIHRNAVVYKGRNRDTAWYSMTQEEWPSRKAAFEAWLDDANVDEAGLQRRSLAQCRQW